MKRDRAILYDECLIVLVDRNEMSFVSPNMENGNNKMKTRSSLKPILEVRGDRVCKMVKNRDGQIVLKQMFDSFWSYKRPATRTHFIYESRRTSGCGFRYKISVADDATTA